MKRIFKLLFSIILIILFVLCSPVSIEASYSKYFNNPIIKFGDSSNWDSFRVYASTITSINNSNKIWFSGSNSSRRQIGYASSLDLLNWTKYLNNPVLSWEITGGNDIGIEHPSALYFSSVSGSIYKLWFNNMDQNQKFQLKYTYSESGIDNWSSPTDIVFNIINNWDSLSRTAPLIITDKDNNYQMWYTAYGDFNGKASWRIGYATSTDGINWTKHPEPVLEADTTWENRGGGGGIGNPSVIYDGVNYQMWYHADRDIGHAVSTDGIHWVKDPDNPVLLPAEADSNAFDFKRVMDPSVLVKDGVYYMYYTGEDKNGRWQIGLATNSDITPIPTMTQTPTPTPTLTITPTLTNTPTLTPTNTPSVTSTPTPSMTSSPTPTTTITSTPTVTPSFTPTLTPTITLTPVPTIFVSPTSTPTPPPYFSPIIIIPGMGASWNPKALFSCNLAPNGEWKIAPYVTVYKRLINTLTKNAGLKLNTELFVYTYDWRQTLDFQADNLKIYIDKILKNKPAGTKVRLIGHSMGGLVIRSYLDKYPDNHKTLKVLTIASPHEGTILSYPAWESGEIWIDDRSIKLAINSLIGQCRLRSLASYDISPKSYLPSKRDIIQSFVPSFKQLLPVFPYLRTAGNIKSIKEMIYQNDWLPVHTFPSNFYNISIKTLSGDKASTLRFLDVINPNISDINRGDWIDGRPIGRENVIEGDGTVLQTSSQIPGAQNEIIPGDHLGIISSYIGIEKILQFLDLSGIKPSEMLPVIENVSDKILSFTLDQPASMRLTDPKGKEISGEENILVKYNPQTGVYKLILNPDKSGKYNLHMNLIGRNEAVTDRTFSLNLRKNKISQFLIILNNLNSPSFNQIPLK